MDITFSASPCFSLAITFAFCNGLVQLSIYAVKLSIKLSMSFFQRQKILKCLWSKHFELQKCGHTEKSNYGLNLSIILMFLTIYGAGKLQSDRSIGRSVINLIKVATVMQSTCMGHYLNKTPLQGFSTINWKITDFSNY